MPSVQVGPEFFAKAFNDYADWRWAWVRELAQNSIDAPNCTRIDIIVTGSSEETVVAVKNNGAPMDEDTLVNKFLTLGASGKNFKDGAVGGFGKAKELVALCHKDWNIRTGTINAAGIGGTYDITQNHDNFHGTHTTVTMAGDQTNSIVNQIKRFAALCQWKGTITLNSQTLDTSLIKGAHRREFTWGVVYTNNSFADLMVVRMGGIPMFTRSVRYKGCVLIELTGASNNVLTSNRDGLTYSAEDELDDFLAEIATNTKSAFKDRTKKVEKFKYAGYKLAGIVAETPVVAAEAADDFPAKKMTFETVLAAALARTTQTGATADAPALTVEQIQKVFRPEFNIRSEIGGKIPSWFIPETFSDNSKRLVSNWIAILVELATLTKTEKPFSVGFVFDPDLEGAHEPTESILFVSPVEIVEKAGKPRQLKTRWKFNAEGNWKLLALAVHEFVHFMGYSYHDENYAGKLTDMMALVLTNRTRFSRHFSAPVAWPSHSSSLGA